MTLADNTERIVEQMRLKTRAVTDERILKDAFTEFEKSAPYTRQMTIRNNFVTKYAGIAAVAAVIVIIWSVYISHFDEKFAAPKQIYNDLAQNENFSISLYQANEEQPFRQIWTSKSLEMTLLKTSEQNIELLTLWDITRNNKMTSRTTASSIQTEKVPHNKMLDELEESLFYAFSLAHFKNISDIPGNAKWTQIQSQDSKVFELSWHQKDLEGKHQYFKWRIILEENTNLLKRTELYVKSDSHDQYRLDSFSIISYPEQEEIRTLIRINFDIVISPPEYQPTGNL